MLEDTLLCHFCNDKITINKEIHTYLYYILN